VANLLEVLKMSKNPSHFPRNGGAALLESQAISILESQSIFGYTKTMKGSGISDWSLWHQG